MEKNKHACLLWPCRRVTITLLASEEGLPGAEAGVVTSPDSVWTDLVVEGAALEEILTGLPKADWAVQTPAPGWSVAHQVAHLAWTDDLAVLAATDETAFGVPMCDAFAGPPGAGRTVARFT